MMSERIRKKTRAGLAASVEAHLRDYFAALGKELPACGLYDRVIAEVEVPLLRVVLEACAGNQLRAASLLGLNRNTLRKKIRDLGLGEDFGVKPLVCTRRKHSSARKRGS